MKLAFFMRALLGKGSTMATTIECKLIFENDYL